MNQNELQQLFPEAKITTAASLGPAYFTLPFQNKWLHIPEHTLSGREKALLKQLLLNEAPTTSDIPKNPGAQFLLGQTTEIPIGLAQTQLLQCQGHRLQLRGLGLLRVRQQAAHGV